MALSQAVGAGGLRRLQKRELVGLHPMAHSRAMKIWPYCVPGSGYMPVSEANSVGERLHDFFHVKLMLLIHCCWFNGLFLNL